VGSFDVFAVSLETGDSAAGAASVAPVVTLTPTDLASASLSIAS